MKCAVETSKSILWDNNLYVYNTYMKGMRRSDTLLIIIRWVTQNNMFFENNFYFSNDCET
jgi:hypothetical protein